MDTETSDGKPITVRALMALLTSFPPDARVVVNGYEDGYDNVTRDSLSLIKARPNPDARWWDGENNDASGKAESHDFSAVLIARGHEDTHV